MTVHIDNTNIVRVTNAVSTALDGTETPLTENGTYTLYDINYNEVVGQDWPSDLTLISDGNYAGYLESDLILDEGKRYIIEINIGSDVNNKANWEISVFPEKRKS